MSAFGQRLRAAAPLSVVVGLGLFHARSLLAGQVPYLSDIIRTDLPMRIFVQGALREGRLPQWFPFDGLGMQYIGNAEGLFRPFTLLYALPDVLWAMNLELIGSSLVGLVGAYLLGRALGHSREVSASLAVLFGFSGYALSLQLNLPYLAPFQTIPWVLWATQRVLTSERPWPWAALGSALWALVLLGGDPLLSVLLVAGLAALMTSNRAFARWKHVVAMGALMSGFSAIWVLPAYALFKESVRVAWTTPDTVDRALHWGRLPELVLGGLWPNADDEAIVKHLLDGNHELWAWSIYVGPVVVALIALGLWRRPRTTLPWAVVAIGFIWASMGSEGGLHTVLRAVLPLLNRFRYPEKFLSMAAIAVAIAAAEGLTALLAEERLRARWGRLAGASAAFVVALLGAMLALTWSGPGPFEALTPDAVPMLHVGWAWGAGSALGFLGAFTLLMLAAKRWPLALLACPVLLDVELGLAHRHQAWTLPRERVTQVPLFCKAALESGLKLGQARVLSLVDRPPLYLAPADAEAWLAGRLNVMEPDTNVLCGLESVAPPNLSGTPARLRAALKALSPTQFSNLFNVGLWVTELAPDAAAPEGLVARSGRFALVRPPGTMAPRAWVGAPHWVQSADEARSWLATHAVEALRSPVLEGDARQTGQGEGQVNIESYAAEEVVLRATMTSAGAVVLNDLHSSGWTAELDGQPTEIFAANALTRAVLVPEGVHEIRFSYETPLLATGFRLSALTLVFALLLVLWDRRRDTNAPHAAN